MYRSIMVPLDGSPFSEQALPVAIALARRCAARLHLVHVRTGSRPVRGRAGVRCDPERDYLDAVAARVSDDLAESVSFALLADTIAGVSYSNPPRRAVADVLETYVREHAIDLVVMTTHGRGGISRAWLGSVADSFIRQSTAPILLIRPDARERSATAARQAPARHILIPLDGSETAERVIGAAVKLGSPSAARYLLLRVVTPLSVVADYGPPSAVFDDPTLSDRRREAVEYVSRLAERMSDDGFDVAGAVVIAPSAAAAITEYADAHDADLIAIGTRGLGGPRRMLLGSVADKIVRTSRRPVLVCNTALAATGTPRGEELVATATAV